MPSAQCIDECVACGVARAQHRCSESTCLWYRRLLVFTYTGRKNAATRMAWCLRDAVVRNLERTKANSRRNRSKSSAGVVRVNLHDEGVSRNAPGASFSRNSCVKFPSGMAACWNAPPTRDATGFEAGSAPPVAFDRRDRRLSMLRKW